MLIRAMLLLITGMLALCATGDDFAPARPMPSLSLSDERVDVIAFGSCFNGSSPDHIYSTIQKAQPDVFLFIGDNVYAADERDDPGLASLRSAYADLAKSKPFRALRRRVPVLATWDDHDFGLNDAGGDWLHKMTSQALFQHVWAVADDDPRQSRDGVYFKRTVGPRGERVQFILLDTRFFRPPLYRPTEAPAAGGRYLPTDDPKQSMLGDAQWNWLASALAEPADVRIIATSIQLIADGHNWEAWRTMPKERERFLALLGEIDTKGVILISGDRHSSAMYRLDDARLDVPLWEVTASSLNRPLTALVSVDEITAEPGPNRVGDPFYDTNFGIIEIDWQASRAILQIRDEAGRTVRASTAEF